MDGLTLHMTKTFGQWVKEQREMRHYTKTKCADRAGVSIQRWAQVESDESSRKDNKPPNITRETVRWVALALDVPIKEAMQAAGFVTDEEAADAVKELGAKFGIPVRTIEIGPGAAEPTNDIDRKLQELAENQAQILDMLRQLLPPAEPSKSE